MASSKMAINSLLSGTSSNNSSTGAAPAARNPHPATTQNHSNSRPQATHAPSAPPHPYSRQHQQSPAASPPSPPPPPSRSSALDVGPAASSQPQPKQRTTKSKRKDAPLIQRATSSPQRFNRNQTPTLPHSALAQAQSHSTSPPVSSASTLGSSHTISSTQSTPSADHKASFGYGPITMPPPAQQSRGPTEKMDFLADLAAMQNPQQASSPSSRSLRTSLSHENPRSPSIPSLSRRSSAMLAATDHPMTDAPTATLQPRSYNTPSLDQSQLQEVSDLTKQLAENSFLYESHAKLIKLLHIGLMNHVCPADDLDHLRNPHDYSLLLELRQARAAMDSRFPVGENLWTEWILDECMLARNTDDRIAVMELCQKAVQDEVGSTKIWRLSGDWVWLLYRTAHDISGVYDSNSFEQHPILGRMLAKQRWTEDEKDLGRELITSDLLMDQWQQAVRATEWHLGDSHVVWDPYVEILMHDLTTNHTVEKVHQLKDLFRNRLRQPHATWDESFQRFSQFTSRYDNDNYEQIMISANEDGTEAKTQYSLRQEFESRLQRSVESGDQDTEWTVMMEYLEWESNQLEKAKNPVYAFDLVVGLMERANLRFPTDAELWEDHVDFLTEHPLTRHPLLQVVRNATRHCPWSGSLWSKRLVALEAAGNAFNEIEDVKHHATSSGLLEGAGGVDELVKVCAAWCGFLRRRAFAEDAGEDERDVAEVGIRSELETVKAIGEKKYGKEFKGDAGLRMQRIYIKFLSQAGRYDEVRSLWLQLSATYGNEWEFWDAFYMWEMLIWGKLSSGMNPPEHATTALQRAIRQPNLNWPEHVIATYLHHCMQHESADRLQEAQVEARRILKQVGRKRAKEAAESAAAQQYPAVIIEEDGGAALWGEKRKREGSSASQVEVPSKRNRWSDDTEEEPPHGNAPSLEETQLKRDREHTTIMVKHLPADTTETAVRQFFRDVGPHLPSVDDLDRLILEQCGKIMDLQLRPSNDGGNGCTATVEFESKEDVLSAKTKSMKPFNGQSIQIEVGTETTLFVTSYPPEADEAYMRKLFSPFGDIIEVRFPSLKFNTQRRFCYVQFASAEQATAATRLDGTALRDNVQLVAKLSNPSEKADRTGPREEGREIYVGNVNFKASEADVRAVFDRFGSIERVRIPANLGGRRIGVAFVVYTTREAAAAALEMNLREFQGRLLTVETSSTTSKGSKRTAKKIINTASPHPDSTTHDQTMADAAVDGSPRANSPAAGSTTENVESQDYRARTLTLRNIPDTVNVDRIRALAEKYGALRKVNILPSRGEAYVEYVSMKDVGKAEMSLNGYEIAKDVTLEVVAGASERGEVGGIKKSGADDNAIKGKNKISTPFVPMTTRRPGLGMRGGARLGARGFAGKKTAADGRVTTDDSTKHKDGGKDANGLENENNNAFTTDKQPTKPKSNADFRAFLGGK